jgi:hypothetical protein
MDRNTETMLTFVIVIVVFLSAFYAYDILKPTTEKDWLIGDWYCTAYEGYDEDGNYVENAPNHDLMMTIDGVKDDLFYGTYRNSDISGVRYVSTANGEVIGFSAILTPSLVGGSYSVECIGAPKSDSGVSDRTVLYITETSHSTKETNNYSAVYYVLTKSKTITPIVSSMEDSGAAIAKTSAGYASGHLADIFMNHEWDMIETNTVGGVEYTLSRYLYNNNEYSVKGWTITNVKVPSSSVLSTTHVLKGTVNYNGGSSDFKCVFFTSGTMINSGILITDDYKVAHLYLKYYHDATDSKNDAYYLSFSYAGVFEDVTGDNDVLTARFTFLRRGDILPDVKEEALQGTNASDIENHYAMKFISSEYMKSDGTNSSNSVSYSMTVDSVSKDKILWCAENGNTTTTGFATSFSSGAIYAWNNVTCMKSEDGSFSYAYVWIIPDELLKDSSSLSSDPYLTIKGMVITNGEWESFTIRAQLVQT